MRYVAVIINAVGDMADTILQAYSILLVIAVLLSWVRPDPYNPIVRTIRMLTEPLLHLVRRIMPRAMLSLGIDLSPILVFFAIRILRELLLILREDVMRLLLR